MHLLALVTLSVLWACTVQAAAPGCCMPNKFEMFEIMQVAASKHDDDDVDEEKRGGGSLTMIYAKISVDGTRKMTNTHGASIIEGKQTMFRVLQDFSKNEEYLLNGDGSKCRVVALRHNWTAPCLPADAKEVFTGYMGINPQFNTQTFQVKTPRQMMEMKADGMEVYLSVSSADCSFTGESVHGRRGKVGFLVNVAIYNTTTGIKDPSVFDVPASCKQTKLEDPIFRHKPTFLP